MRPREVRAIEAAPPPSELERRPIAGEAVSAAGAALDLLAAALFSGPQGRVRAGPLLAQFNSEIGGLSEGDPEFDLMQVTRMDWALCDVPASGDAQPGDSWGRRVLLGRVEGVELESSPLRLAAASALSGLFEVYPGDPTWVRDRVSGLVARLVDGVGPWPSAEPGRPAALWELRLVPDPSGGFHIARPPIDYPIELLSTLDELLPRRFAAQPWPAMQDLRRARLRYLRAGQRTPIERMLSWR